MLSWNAFEMLNKFNKIGLKGLDWCTYKVDGLNLIKVFEDELISIFIKS